MRNFVPTALVAVLLLAGCNPTGGITLGTNGVGVSVSGSASGAPDSESGPDGAPAEGEVGAPLSGVVEGTLGEASAAAPIAVGGTVSPGLLGVETATLGDASLGGLWAQTRYVSQPTPGRIRVPSTGSSVEVELRPSGGAGARLSLSAMRQLGLSLTSIAEVEISATGGA